MSLDDQAEKLNQTDDDLIRELSELSPIDYDRRRKQAAEQLGCRPLTLDKLVNAARSNAAEPEAKGRTITYKEIEPWPDQVNMAEALEDARQAILRHMHIQGRYAVIASLWAAHAHCYDLFTHTPRLGATAPDAECGKTLLMQLVGAMVPRPQPVEIMKAAPFFRLAEAHRPCFLIDECDVFIKEDSDLLAAINNGWEPHGGVPRCVGDSSNMEVRLFSTHSPVVVGGIKLEKVLPATTQSRTLIIQLERATNGEIRVPYDKRKHLAGLNDIGRKFARWITDHREAIASHEAVMPDGSFNRNADKWRPLVTIADLAGGHWPELVRRAYSAERDSTPRTATTQLQLLADIREIWPEEKTALHTDDLIRLLCDLPESRWTEYNFKAYERDKKRIQPTQLASLLKDYKSSPVQVWDGRNKRGYELAPLEKAWKRYLGGDLPARPLEPTAGAASSDSASASDETHLSGEKPLNPTAGAASSDLAGKTPFSSETENWGYI